MKLVTLLLATLTLTGCATGCQKACVFGFGPGNPAFDKIALIHDQQDECQTGGKDEARRKALNRPEGYTAPEWCYANKRRATITNRYGQTIGYVK